MSPVMNSTPNYTCPTVYALSFVSRYNIIIVFFSCLQLWVRVWLLLWALSFNCYHTTGRSTVVSRHLWLLTIDTNLQLEQPFIERDYHIRFAVVGSSGRQGTEGGALGSATFGQHYGVNFGSQNKDIRCAWRWCAQRYNKIGLWQLT